LEHFFFLSNLVSLSISFVIEAKIIIMIMIHRLKIKIIISIKINYLLENVVVTVVNESNLSRDRYLLTQK